MHVLAVLTLEAKGVYGMSEIHFTESRKPDEDIAM